MINLIKKHWPVIISVVMLWGAIVILLISSIKLNNGHFGYPLDDVYIHMSMAKNVVINGVWGIDKYEFASSTSSPLWTLLLSLIYFLFGVNEVSPFIINIILGTLLMGILYSFLRKFLLPRIIILVTLLAIIFFTPLLPIIFGGMEHVLHALLTILFVCISAKLLTENKYVFKDYLFLLILAPFLTSIRYEGLFLIFVVCSLFVLRKRPLYSFLLGGVSLIPIVIYGMISVLKGWYFFPNSLLLKGKIPSFSLTEIYIFLFQGYVVLVTNIHVFILLLIALVLFVYQYYKQKTFWKSPIILLAIFIVITILHVLFAGMGWVYRYEAYLIVLGIFVIAIVMFISLPEKLLCAFDKKLIPMYISIIFLISIILFPLFKRGRDSLFIIRYGIKNVYEQQYQMGLFLKQFYQGKAVAANDIGAINYLADIKCLDLWGLNSMDIAKAKRNGSYSTEKINYIVTQKDIKIAVVYSQWFDAYGGIPPGWIKVGEWTILNNVVCGGNTVSFFAVNPLEKDNLKVNLKAFSSYLPKDIVQSGDYIK